MLALYSHFVDTMESIHVSMGGEKLSAVSKEFSTAFQGPGALIMAGVCPGGIESGRSPVTPASIFKGVRTLLS